MARRFFKAEITWSWIDTRQGLIAAPRVELQIRLSTGESRFAPPVACQWDTGSQLSVMSEQVARDLGIDLDREPDTRLGGITGVKVPAWVVQRFARFPGLDGWQFKLEFLVQKGSADPLPLLGMGDTYDNFEIVSRGDDYAFFLKEGHRGEPLPRDTDCGS